MQTVLAVDDEPSVRQAYRFILGKEYNVALAESGPAALAVLDETHVDLILLDMVMPGMHSLDVLTELQRRDALVPVIVVTASSSVEFAVEAMKRGAREYLTKPFDVQRLLVTVEHTLETVRMGRELAMLRQAGLQELEVIVGSSPALLTTLSAARQAMTADFPAIVTGEPGTGKDLVAQAIHAGSSRRAGPFVTVSCSTIPPALVARELFGVDRSEWGKARVADGGTLYVEEITRMSPSLQERLLKLLVSGECCPEDGSRPVAVDVRLVCSTSVPTEKSLANGQLLPGLWDRLRATSICMPPLRRRVEDIPALVDHFIQRHGPRVGARTRQVSEEAQKVLQGYGWPGNVRELENVVQRLLIHHGDVEVLGREHLRLNVGNVGDRELVPDELERMPLNDALRQVEEHLLRRALQHSGGSTRAAAALLALPLEALERKLALFQIDPLSCQTSPSGKSSTHPRPLS